MSLRVSQKKITFILILMMHCFMSCLWIAFFACRSVFQADSAAASAKAVAARRAFKFEMIRLLWLSRIGNNRTAVFKMTVLAFDI